MYIHLYYSCVCVCPSWDGTDAANVSLNRPIRKLSVIYYIIFRVVFSVLFFYFVSKTNINLLIFFFVINTTLNLLYVLITRTHWNFDNFFTARLYIVIISILLSDVSACGRQLRVFTHADGQLNLITPLYAYVWPLCRRNAIAAECDVCMCVCRRRRQNNTCGIDSAPTRTNWFLRTYRTLFSPYAITND